MVTTKETEIASVPPAFVAAARILRGLGWLAVAVPTVYVAVYFPGSLVILLFGGTLIAMPLLAFGVMGLRLSKSLRDGFHAAAAGTFAAVQGAALLAIAVHGTTWDPNTPGEGAFFAAIRFTTFLGGAASAGAVVLIAAAGRSARRRPRDLELRPALWPWILAALGILLLSFAGCPQVAAG